MTRRLMFASGLLLLLLFALFKLAGHSSAQTATHLVINEVFDSNTLAREYFEIYNPTTSDIDLSNYVIYNQNGADALSQLSNPVIGAGQFRAIASTAFSDGTIGGSGGLQNPSDFLALVRTGVTDTTIDVVNWGPPSPGWPNYQRFASSFFVQQLSIPAADSTRDLQRYPDGRDTDSASDFQQLDQSPNSASCADPYEYPSDNNISSGIIAQANNTVTLHRLCGSGEQSSDVDFIRISMQTTVSYTVSAAVYNANSPLNLAVALYDGSGALVATAATTTTIVYQPSSNADYYFQVTNANGVGGPGADYLYTVRTTVALVATPTPTGSPQATATPTPFCNDSYEPDNSIGQAKPLELNVFQDHTICNSANPGLADNDWYALAAGPGKIYTIFTSELTNGIDTKITVYDRTGKILAENDDKASRCNLCSEVNLAFPAVDTYYLWVRDNRGGGGYNWNYRIDFTSTGAQPNTATPTETPTIDPNAPTATATLGPCTDAYEPDGTPASAHLLLIRDVQPGHTFCPAGDADWYRFFGGVGKAYTIQTAKLGIGVDTYLYLFDSDGSTVIAQNDDGAGEGVESSLDFFPQRDAFYYIMVKNKGDLGLPSMTYDLSLTVRANAGGVAPTASATPIIAPIPTGTQVPPTDTPTVAPGTEEVPPTDTPTGTPQPTFTPTLTPTATQTPAAPTAEPSSQALIPAPGLRNAVGSGPTPTPFVRLPATGSDGVAPAKPDLIALAVTVYVDRNNNNKFDAGEGVRDLVVNFNEIFGANTASATTNASGQTAAQLVRGSKNKVFIPYLNWTGEIQATTSGLVVKLPAAKLPQRIP